MLFEIERIVKIALQEDIGLGDITTEVTVAPETVARA
ncbi:MAG: nicotinate-nucleotide diphosphorylase (carboxylating), partial [Chloroflexi bacterium]|nr:nicotinate-nucleotide diphosphorylase (carboxylating) [Chloroflexota bacterium]